MDPLGHARVPDIGRVESQLAGLWRQAASGEQAVVRASSINLVVVCADGDRDAHDATRIVAEISETWPGRALLIAVRPEETGELSAFVSAHCHRGAQGVQVCSEQVTLETGGSGMRLVPGTILQLLVEALPVYTLWRRGELGGDGLMRPLRDLSDRLIVDSSGFDRPAERLIELKQIASDRSWTGHAADVSWARSEPWREAIASFFDPPAMRAHLNRLTRVRIEASGPAHEGGYTAAGAYTAGWLASRLEWRPGLRPNEWRRPDGAPIAMEFHRVNRLPDGELHGVRLHADLGESSLAFVARRIGKEHDGVHLEIEGGIPEFQPHRIKLPARGEAALICGLLQHASRDRVFEAGLSDAARMAPPV